MLSVESPPMKRNDPAQSLADPQLPFGAVAGDQNATEAAIGELPGPGGIVSRQFQLPRAEPDANISDRPALSTGEIG